MTAVALPSPTTGPAPTRPHPGADTVTMFRRNLRRAVRYPGLTGFVVGIPVALLLLFVYVFGGAFGAGVAPGVTPGAGGRAAYLDYITPAILIFAVVGAGQGTAIGAAMDATSGIMARFKTMAISPGSILAGPVLGAIVQTLLAATVVLGVAVAIGYRPDAGPLDWLAVAGTLVLAALAVNWLCTGMGLSARSVETASNTPMILTAVAFLSSGFVPTDTMPPAVRWFAENQPFTPIIDTLRGLLAGGAGLEASTAALAVAWCALLAAVGYAWSRAVFRRERTA